MLDDPQEGEMLIAGQTRCLNTVSRIDCEWYDGQW
jgi:hypothetical protein